MAHTICHEAQVNDFANIGWEPEKMAWDSRQAIKSTLMNMAQFEGHNKSE